MTHNELKRLAIAKLKEQGIKLKSNANMAQINEAIGIKSFYGHRTQRWHIERWLGIAAEPKVEKPANTTPPPYRRNSFGQFSWRPTRMADIDAAQPPMITPNGIGNDKQPGGFRPVVW